ncbi:DUF881 domain-containing protein [Streptomyces sp. ODS28]|uniref:DUF881 domain-containing protein n=1 Tax=Streptomyces sp. ODS28 TaxID=3136688 RepID=UPI0031E9E77E
MPPEAPQGKGEKQQAERGTGDGSASGTESAEGVKPAARPYPTAGSRQVPRVQGASGGQRPGGADSADSGAGSGSGPASASADSASDGAGDGGSGGGTEEGPGSGGGEERPKGRAALRRALWPPKVTRAQLIVALLLFVLGLGLAIQVRSTSENSALRGARHEDLVRILDELDNRTKRLEDEKTSLERQRTELENSSDQAEEARKQTRQKERQLGVLAGTVGAQGPGIELKVSDPGGAVEADMLLDTVQELRAAGAEAIEVNNVRVVADTYFSDAGGGVKVDGRAVRQPYTFEVIGKPQDLEPALNIPGGVVQTLRKEQATVDVSRSDKITVDALRPSKRPDYARSSSQ